MFSARFRCCGHGCLIRDICGAGLAFRSRLRVHDLVVERLS